MRFLHASIIQRLNYYNSKARFKKEFARYREEAAGTGIKFSSLPQLMDVTENTSFDPHYTYQGPWVMRKLVDGKPSQHVDVGSWVVYLGFFASLQQTTFVDIRPAKLNMPGLNPQDGSVLDLSFKDKSVESLSCLHVIEHVGLGRYGDPLDPKGTEKAARELTRVLALGGDLYISLPVGKEVTYFNAHRVTDPARVLELFADLELVSFSVILDDGTYKEDVSPVLAKSQDYACGLYHFKRKR